MVVLNTSQSLLMKSLIVYMQYKIDLSFFRKMCCYLLSVLATRAKHMRSVPTAENRRCQAREHEPGVYQAQKNAGRVSQVAIGFKFAALVADLKKKNCTIFTVENWTVKREPLN